MPKQKSTTSGQSIHNSLEIVIKSAHAVYNRKRIGLRVDAPEGRKRHTGGVKGHQGYKRVIPKPNKIVGARRPVKCPKHRGQRLEASEQSFSITIIDLVFLSSGARKTITKYVGRGGYCCLCRRLYRPPKIVRLSTQLFGYTFQAWVIYQRIVLRLPYKAISQVSEELFGESISDGSIGTFILRFSNYYVDTEKLLLKAILDSPFIHVDETKINVQGFNQYVGLN